jgi:hypothetical protein
VWSEGDRRYSRTTKLCHCAINPPAYQPTVPQSHKISRSAFTASLDDEHIVKSVAGKELRLRKPRISTSYLR